MPGTNVFARRQAQVRGSTPDVRLNNCVFISHKREDSGMAHAVAEALTDFDIDVWLDLQELGFPEPNSKEEHLRLTAAIEEGLNASSHLLALITTNTKGSWWVPFEIGVCRSRRKPLAFLLHKDVRDIPSYFAVGTGLLNKYDLYDWASDLSSRKLDVKQRARLAALTPSSLDHYVELIRGR